MHYQIDTFSNPQVLQDLEGKPVYLSMRFARNVVGLIK
jgi:hypothetical protein